MILTGKTVLVTGGSKGIGRAIVEAMAQQGANVVINYSSDLAAAEATAEAATRYSVRTLIVKADITNEKEVESMFEAIQVEFSSLDVLVNNAGIFDVNDSPDNIEVFEKIYKINFLAQVIVTNYARKLLEYWKNSLHFFCPWQIRAWWARCYCLLSHEGSA